MLCVVEAIKTFIAMKLSKSAANLGLVTMAHDHDPPRRLALPHPTPSCLAPPPLPDTSTGHIL